LSKKKTDNKGIMNRGDSGPFLDIRGTSINIFLRIAIQIVF
jgi:hypothetical protein